MKFTDKHIKGLKPKAKPYRIYEKGTDKGFGLQITPTGSISFFVQYAEEAKQKFYNLGRYPSVSLAGARELCREIRLRIDQGIDPRKTPKQAVYGSVSDLFDYYTATMQTSEKKTWETVKNALDYNCQSILKIPANTVEPIHIRTILYDIISRGSPVQANRVRSYLRRAFELGIFHDNDPKNLKSSITFNIKSNPVDFVPKDGSAESVGERNLSFQEIKLIWNESGLNGQFDLVLKLLIIYGCRPWELLGAEKSEFDFEALLWSIPPVRVKNKRWLLLPITPMALETIKNLVDYSRNSAYLVPGRHNDNKPIYKTSLQHATDRITIIDKFLPRDIRRTVKTRMGEIGIDKSIRDRLQNHALNDVSSRHYDRYDYIKEKRDTLLIWEEKLGDLITREHLLPMDRK
jgi:integrase